MLARSRVGAHLLLAVDGGSFVSLLEPRDHAAAAVAACRNRHTWPVFVGDRSQRTLMLSSPIVLYDSAAVAKESPGDLCDAAQIDEIVSLRILTMTDDEKRQARATDPGHARSSIASRRRARIHWPRCTARCAAPISSTPLARRRLTRHS